MDRCKHEQQYESVDPKTQQRIYVISIGNRGRCTVCLAVAYTSNYRAESAATAEGKSRVFQFKIAAINK